MTDKGLTKREARTLLTFLESLPADSVMKLCVFFFKLAAKKYGEERK